MVTPEQWAEVRRAYPGWAWVRLCARAMGWKEALTHPVKFAQLMTLAICDRP